MSSQITGDNEKTDACSSRSADATPLDKVAVFVQLSAKVYSLIKLRYVLNYFANHIYTYERSK